MYDHLPYPGIGKLMFRMGQPLRRLERRSCELADFRKVHGHCNVPQRCIEAGYWAMALRIQYWLYQEEKKMHMTLSRIQASERLGFVWRLHYGIDSERPARKKKKLESQCLMVRTSTSSLQNRTIWVQNNSFKTMDIVNKLVSLFCC
jgi:hypothetical protein